jgi:uncharacterized protein YktA (UPF0223 family)
MMEYQYPIDLDWSTQEIVDVILFFECVEMAYETGINRDDLLNAYRRFKEIVPSKAQEKKYCGEFEEQSGYSPYRTVKAGQAADVGQKIKMS